MTTLDLARLLADATPGPWSVHPHPRGYDEDRLQLGALDGPHWSAWIPALRPGDARLIAAAPDLARRCLALEAMFTARLHGIEARLGALPRESCPHTDPAEAVAWLDGWISGGARREADVTDARPCGVCGQIPDSGERRRALERDAATWERLARYLGEQRTEPDCDCCGGSGCAPDGSTCDCAGWYPKGSGEAERRIAALEAERAEEEARAERYAAALNSLEATGSEGERIRVWREQERALSGLRIAARRVLGLYAPGMRAIPLWSEEHAALDALRAALGEKPT